jgi:hypothetical protein
LVLKPLLKAITLLPPVIMEPMLKVMVPLPPVIMELMLKVMVQKLLIMLLMLKGLIQDHRDILRIQKAMRQKLVMTVLMQRVNLP